ncbi:hypothetical protein D3C87_1709550 [compost metagenome]
MLKQRFQVGVHLFAFVKKTQYRKHRLQRGIHLVQFFFYQVSSLNPDLIGQALDVKKGTDLQRFLVFEDAFKFLRLP